jgi:predicted acylesterase/phospholipase RssA
LTFNRRSFLARGAASTAGALSLGLEAGARTIPPVSHRGTSLVLTGGINRGAYQAGIVLGMAREQGLKDGEPLDFQMITGASIGTLNAFLVATAQYTRLREVWEQVGSRNVLQIKKEYEPVTDESSGVLTRIFTALSLASGLRRSVTGILNPEPIKALLADFADPRLPTFIPFTFTATNLTRKRLETFMRRATAPWGLARQARIDAALEPRELIKPHYVTDGILHSALFASAALPVLFDPIEIPRAEDPSKLDQYVDGGLTDNVPVNVAGAVSSVLHVVAVDPPPDPAADPFFADALSVGTRVFSIMQGEIIRYATELTYASNLLLDPNLPQIQAGGYQRDTLPLQILFKRPATELPGKLGDFNDTAANLAMIQRGIDDAPKAWENVIDLLSV